MLFPLLIHASLFPLSAALFYSMLLLLYTDFRTVAKIKEGY